MCRKHHGQVGFLVLNELTGLGRGGNGARDGEIRRSTQPIDGLLGGVIGLARDNDSAYIFTSLVMANPKRRHQDNRHAKSISMVRLSRTMCLASLMTNERNCFMWRVENKEGGVSGAKCCRGVIGLRPLADKGCAGECRAVWESGGERLGQSALRVARRARRVNTWSMSG